MKLLSKLNTLLRAGARESAERITDANAIRIYRQEIVDAEHLLERRRQRFAGLVAMRRDLEGEIAAARRHIRSREEQVAAIEPAGRTRELLLLAARDIAATQTLLAGLERRRGGLIERIGCEQLTLRNLLAEIREHRRELKILAAELADTGRGPGIAFGSTVAAHLETLRSTREGLVSAVAGTDLAEASLVEANDRIDGDPFDRELAAQGRDPTSLQLEAVLEKLMNIDYTAPGAEPDRTEDRPVGEL